MKKVMQQTAEEIKKMIRFEGAGILGDAGRLLRITQIAMGSYLIFFYFTVRENPPELIVATLLLIGAAFLPAYLWCSGKVQGLPILPIIALKYIPSYVYPVQVGMKLLEAYSTEEQAEAVFATAWYLLLLTLVWQQICNRTSRPTPIWFSIESKKSTAWMIGLLVVYLGFQLVQDHFPPGAASLIRGVIGNGSSLACFILSFQSGQGILSAFQRGLFLGLLGTSLLVDAGSLILANCIVKVGVVLAGYSLAKGKVPWKSLLLLVPLLWVLHAGKSKMREEYWQDGVMGTTKVGVTEYPQLFARWLEIGWRETVKEKSAYDPEGQNAAERGSLLNVFLKINTMSPSQVPYLEGLTYRAIPRLLIPRFLNKDKGFSHEGNVWLAYLYKFTSEEGLMRVSIQFDLMMESYANFGYLGMAVLAIVLGLVIGWVTRWSTGVPVMSFRFLFAVLFLNSYLGANNTLGVFVTTLWQGTIGLWGISWLMMSQMPNPFFVLEKLKWESKKRKAGVDGKDIGYGISDIGDRETEDRGLRTEGGPTSLQASPTREELRRVENEAAPERHERPTRFVYGQKKKD